MPSLLIEFTDSMIYNIIIMVTNNDRKVFNTTIDKRCS